MNKMQEQYWLNERHLSYHRRQFTEPYRSTVFIGELLSRRFCPNLNDCTALDVACGAGSNICYLSGLYPSINWTGIDQADQLFPIGYALMKEQGLPKLPLLRKGDIFGLNNYFQEKSFDLVLSLQTLSWMPSYEPLLGPLLSAAKSGGRVVISSLFTDSLVDAKIVLTQYKDSTFNGFEDSIYYNVYCLERFIANCKECGAKNVEVVDFDIDIDLPKPAHRHMGTYTEMLTNGRRIQLSGPLLMPWKVLWIEM